MTEKAKKKILYIITKSVWGGAQKYVFDLAVNLPRDKFKVVIAGGGHGVMAEKLKAAGFEYLPIKSFQRDVNFFKDFFAFFEIFYILFKTKPDIIHVSSSKAGGVVGIAGFFYLLAKKTAMLFRLTFPCVREGETILPLSYGALKIFTIHGWAFLEQRPKWQNWLIKFFSKLTCLFYDKIICVSENDYKVGLKYKIAPARKMIVIHNGINSSDYNFLSKNEARAQLEKNIPFPLVGSIGEFNKNKGYVYLIEATDSIEDNRFLLKTVLIGWGESKEELKKEIKNSKSQDSAFLIDKNILTDSNTANYLKAFDIFVLPSLKEGLPYTILEAGLARLPVIATNVGGIPEIIENEKSGLLVPPANPEELAKAIKKLIDDKTLREKLANNLHQKITQEFTLSKMLNATIAAYENLLIDVKKYKEEPWEFGSSLSIEIL